MAEQIAIDDYRKNKKSKDLLLLSEIEDTQLLELMVEGHENRICNYEEFQEAIEQLPQQQREYLVEYALGYEQKEIATKKGISESTVSKNTSQGRTNLRKKSFLVTEDMKSVGIPFAYLARKPYKDMDWYRYWGAEREYNFDEYKYRVDPIIQAEWDKIESIFGLIGKFKRELERRDKSPQDHQADQYIERWIDALVTNYEKAPSLLVVSSKSFEPDLEW